MAREATKEEKEVAAQLEAALQKEQQESESGVQEVAGNAPAEQPDAPNSEPPKRKRGRPSDAERALKESLGVPGAETGGAKRGPKPKAKGSDPSTLAKSLVGIHQLAAMVTQIPEAQLSEGEAQALAEAVIAVCNEYGLSIDGKTGAAMQLFGACAMVYGPRVFSFRMRMAQQRVQMEKEAQANGATQAPHY